MKRDYDALIDELRNQQNAFDPMMYWHQLFDRTATAIIDLRRENEKLRPKRIRQTSKKRAKVLREAKPIRDAYMAEHLACEFTHEIYGPCGLPSHDCHEIVSRARGGSLSDPDNLAALCRFHHDWVTQNPKEATRMGWLRSKEVVE